MTQRHIQDVFFIKTYIIVSSKDSKKKRLRDHCDVRSDHQIHCKLMINESLVHIFVINFLKLVGLLICLCANIAFTSEDRILHLLHFYVTVQVIMLSEAQLCITIYKYICCDIHS